MLQGHEKTGLRNVLSNEQQREAMGHCLQNTCSMPSCGVRASDLVGYSHSRRRWDCACLSDHCQHEESWQQNCFSSSNSSAGSLQNMQDFQHPLPPHARPACRPPALYAPVGSICPLVSLDAAAPCVAPVLPPPSCKPPLKAMSAGSKQSTATFWLLGPHSAPLGSLPGLCVCAHASLSTLFELRGPLGS